MSRDPQAPRLHAMLEHVAGRSIISFPRSEWSTALSGSTGLVVFDVRRTPLGGVASNASIIANVAQQFSTQSGRVSIYRHDARDHPQPVNTDHYTVMLNLEADPALPDMIRRASTQDNANLRSYLRQNVFLVKEGPGPDHWLPEVPAEVRAVMTKVSSSGTQGAA